MTRQFTAKPRNSFHKLALNCLCERTLRNGKTRVWHESDGKINKWIGHCPIPFLFRAQKVVLSACWEKIARPEKLMLSSQICHSKNLLGVQFVRDPSYTYWEDNATLNFTHTLSYRKRELGNVDPFTERKTEPCVIHVCLAKDAKRFIVIRCCWKLRLAWAETAPEMLVPAIFPIRNYPRNPIPSALIFSKL